MRFTQAIPQSVKSSALYRGIRNVALFRQSDRFRQLRQRWRRDSPKIESYLVSSTDPKFHLGCGNNPLSGWLNTDFYPDDPAILHLDLTRQFPLPDNSATLVFSEHVIEHLPLSGGLNMLKESFRVLRPGGTIRISTPSLPALLDIYQQPDEPRHRAYIDWHRSTWLADAEPATPAVVLNDFFRNWGHLLIYDPETLTSLLEAAGFEQIRSCPLQRSDNPLLANLENDTRMPAGLLALHTMIFEARKSDKSHA